MDARQQHESGAQGRLHDDIVNSGVLENNQSNINTEAETIIIILNSHFPFAETETGTQCEDGVDERARSVLYTARATTTRSKYIKGKKTAKKLCLPNSLSE